MSRDTLPPTQAQTPSGTAAVDAELPDLRELSSSRLLPGEVLGRGGMGEVRVARDTRLGRQLALKTATTDDVEATHRFVREARVQGQLEHPGIVPVHELALDEDGRPFFTMKRVRGVTLGEVLRDATFPRRRLLTFLQAVSKTLDFAHSRGVVHRDVKPANVMLGDFGEVYLLDWGLAKVGATEDRHAPPLQGDSQPGVTVAGTVMGTAGYLAPEQAAGRPATSASDVWALGVMLYEALTGERLISATQYMEALIATQQLRAPSPRAKRADVSPELDLLCLAALAPEPSARPTAREFGERLEAVLAGERDVELRASLAERHAKRAAEAATRALENGSLDARREALREVGQALALEPGLALAHDTFGRLLAEAPRELPPEVQADLDAAQRDSEATGIRNGLEANLFTGLLIAPTVFWVRDWTLFGLLVALWVITTAFIAAVAKQRPARRLSRLLGVAALSSVNMCLGFMAGPFIIVPAIATAYAMGTTLWIPRAERVVAIAMQLASVFVPVALSGLGLIPRLYESRDDGVFIHPAMLDISSNYWFVATSVAVVATLLSGCVAMLRVRNELEAARRALSLQRWNLEQLRTAAPRG